MSGPAISHTYRYGFTSDATPDRCGVILRLATSDGLGKSAEYFRGKLTRPLRAADLLRGLVQVVQSRFYLPPTALERVLRRADPVVTCSEDVVRFEAFSGCCSTYARVDLLPPALQGKRIARGTTNVDFNAPMRDALARVRESDDLHLAIGADSVMLSRAGETVVEKRVMLPLGKNGDALLNILAQRKLGIK